MPEIVKLAENVTLYCGECEDVLPTLAPVSAVVTDPPYGIGFMGKGWDHAVPDAPIWAAVQQGFGFIGIERDPEYFRIAVARVEKALQQGVLGI